jgi:ribosome biogenesis GTPase A
MAGKRAFSAKAKKEQLRLKRASNAAASSLNPVAASSAGAIGPALSSVASSAANHHRPAPIKATSRSSRRPADRYRLKFAADSDKAREKARTQAFVPVSCQGVLESEVAARADLRSLGVFDVRSRDASDFSGPRRPPWTYEESVPELEAREELHFNEWMSRVQSDSEDAAYFEQNLETWRQLWRVVERSDVLVLVADVRFPALHFVPGLYDRITRELGKGMVLALNKCDLVSEHLLNAWKAYFASEFDQLAVALFSCFPDSKLVPSDDNNAEMLSKREMRMARSRLAAWGADQLLAAIDTLELSETKRAHLEEWRRRMDDGDSNEHRHNDGHQSEPAEVDADASVTIGIIGHPNAGKSSMINGVFGRKVVSTSRTPGHTKHLQTMFLSPHVVLCDCPGLVFPGTAPRELQVLAGMYPVAQLREPYAVIKYLADRVPLVSMLDLEREAGKVEAENESPFPGPGGWTAWTICEAWAFKRGFRTAKAARLDVFRAANNILRLAVEGRIVLATTPPGYTIPSEAQADAAAAINGNTTVIDTGVDRLRATEAPSESTGESFDGSAEGDKEEMETGMGMFAMLLHT